MIHCIFHSFIFSCTHSFIASQCESAQLGLTPPQPFQIGRGPLGTAASSLPTFPSSLSWSWDERSQRVKYWSLAPCPHLSRGQPPQNGGTLLPLDHPTHPPPCVFHCLVLLFFSVLPVCPACMHAPQCLCFSSALRNDFLPACSPKWGLLLWLLAPSQVVVVTLLCCAAELSVNGER